ncbi:MAG: hypothetical protein WC621_03250 [Patescibacteria group bacterium]
MRKISIFASLLVLLVLVNISNAGTVYASRTIIVTPLLQLPFIHQVSGPDTVPVNVLSSTFIVTFSSSKPIDTVKVRAIWGDGKADSSTHVTVQNQQFGAFFWHTWITAGTYVVRFEVKNSDGLVFQNKTVVVTGLNQPPVATNVNITGSTIVGQVLTGNYTYSDPDGNPQGVSTFKWYRNNIAISGATSLTYTLVAADLSTTIKFEVTPVAQTGASPGLPVQSTSVGPVVNPNQPPVVTSVTITGNTIVGSTLTGGYTYSDVDGDLQGVSTFKWYRNNVAITGATTATYTLTAADLSATMKFEVTPVAQTGASPGLPVQSSGVGPVVNPNQPPVATNVVITGNTIIGSTLTGSYTYSDADGNPQGVSTFKWYRNNIAITGATSLTYTLVAAELSTTIKFEVTPVAQTGASPGLPVQSSGVGPVVNPNQPPVIDSFTVPVTAVQGSSVNMTLVCHDNDSPTLNIDVNFGDNTPHFTATRTGSLGQIFTIEFSHTFITLGQFIITVAVSDTSGGQSVVVFGGGQ